MKERLHKNRFIKVGDFDNDNEVLRIYFSALVVGLKTKTLIFDIILNKFKFSK